MESQYVPPFDFSSLAPNQSARWNPAAEKWEVYTMPEPEVIPITEAPNV